MMKKFRLLRVISIATVLSIIFSVFTVAPVFAYDYDIEIDPEEGEIGDRVDITGEDWPESDSEADPPEYNEVNIYFSDEEADDNDYIDDDVDNYELVKSGVTIDDDGEIDTRFTVPDELTDGDDDVDVRGGDYYVYVTLTGSDRIRAVAEFRVVAAEIMLSKSSGPVGTEVVITGEDFHDNQELTVYYDNDEIDIERGDNDTNSNGQFTTTIIIPESIADDHIIKVIDESEAEAEAEFSVESEASINMSSGSTGESVVIKGTGFGNTEDVTVQFNSTVVATGKTNIDGNFSIGFTIPVVNAGTYQIEAEDDDNNSASVQLTVSAKVTIDKELGNIGDTVTLNGIGFKPLTQVTVTYASTPQVVAITTSDNNGSFSVTFDVPASAAGTHSIMASDGTNSLVSTFTVESTPPAAPILALPSLEERPKQPVEFDWEDVTDPSGVTYTLQIALDEQFTALIFEDSGISESSYVLPDEAKLNSSEKDIPYWWRVKATDGASNDSYWSEAQAFEIGFMLSLPTWGQYVLWGVVGLLVLGLVFYAGTRFVLSRAN